MYNCYDQIVTLDQSSITIEILYEYLKQFREDFNEFKREVRDRFEQVDKRFEQVDKRFEQVDKGFEQVDKGQESLKHEMREIKNTINADRDKLQEVYESRDRVTVKFTRAWMTASFFIALIVVLMVMAIEKGLA